MVDDELAALSTDISANEAMASGAAADLRAIMPQTGLDADLTKRIRATCSR